MNTLTATTAELVAFYNANVAADKQIKKFADRATAELRVGKLFASIVEAQDEAHRAKYESVRRGQVSSFEIHGHADCPHCGIDLRNGVSQHGDDVNGKPLRHDTHEFECMGCGGGFGETLRHAAKSTSRANAIAATWKDASIAAARAQRTCVRVFSEGGIVGEYKSTAEAFRRLGLPLSKHIPFRMALKAAGSNAISVYTFKVAA